MTQRRTYPKLNYGGEHYVDAVFVNGEFRYAWLPTSANMRRVMAGYEGRRRFAWAATA